VGAVIKLHDILPGTEMGSDIYLQKGVKLPLVKAGDVFPVELYDNLRYDDVKFLYTRSEPLLCECGFVVPRPMPEKSEGVRDAVIPRIRRDILLALRELHLAMLNRNKQAAEEAISAIGEGCTDIVDEMMLLGSAERITVGTLQSPYEFLYHHGLSVAAMSAAIGQVLNMPVYDLIQLTRAAVLHDIGKFIMQPGQAIQHPQLGYTALQSWKMLTPQEQEAIRDHHEVRSDKIGPWARIIAVADVFDTMTATQPGITPLTPSAACKIIAEGAGSEYDTSVVRAFATRVEYRLVGDNSM
jgi:HD-GYP domain-containing protein (c-di-GMP phosphodiesterase class II)